MSNTMTAARNQIVARLIERVETDQSLRDLLKSDPHAALKQILGVDPIPGFKINVIEEKPGEVNIVIPAPIEQDELPDDLLDLASGGTSFFAFVDNATWYGKSTKKPTK